MKIAITIISILMGILSIAAGAAKVALVPQEVSFLGQFGFSQALIMLFGAVQVLAGLLLLVPATRLWGSVIAGVAFAVSAVLLFIVGNVGFAGVSLVPVLLAGVIGYRSAKA